MTFCLPTSPNVQSTAERRVVFSSLNWAAYIQILAALGERRAAHLTYDRGTLEITMPTEEHEFLRALIERFIVILVEELGLNLKTIGSTTLKREDLDRGAEPDNAYYIQNQPLVKGKRIDLVTDPPPDLVVEVDITHTDIDQLSLYAAMGVPEFWRYDGNTWRIYKLMGREYQEQAISSTFPQVAKEMLYTFLSAAFEDEMGAGRSLRQHIRNLG